MSYLQRKELFGYFCVLTKVARRKALALRNRLLSGVEALTLKESLPPLLNPLPLERKLTTKNKFTTLPRTCPTKCLGYAMTRQNTDNESLPLDNKIRCLQTQQIIQSTNNRRDLRTITLLSSHFGTIRINFRGGGIGCIRHTRA